MKRGGRRKVGGKGRGGARPSASFSLTDPSGFGCTKAGKRVVQARPALRAGVWVAPLNHEVLLDDGGGQPTSSGGTAARRAGQ